MAYDAGDYGASLTKALEMIDYKGLAAQARGARRQAARHRLLLLYRGLRHRAVGRGLARRRRRPVGIGEVRVNPVGTVEVLTGSHSHGQGHETTFAQLVADRLGIPSTMSRSSMATPTRCRSAWAPMARAPARSACRPSSRRSTRSKAKGKKIAAHLLEADEADIEFEDGSSR
jgi:carbon-monoxide dehydrogenase large subunit